MKEFKEKFEAILKEHQISDDSAKAISEGVIAGLEVQKKALAEAKAKEDAEVETLVESKFKAIKKDQDESVKIVAENVKKLKKTHKLQLESIRSNVKKLIKEDYDSHKKELAQKVKLFVESKIVKVEKAVKAKILEESKAEESKLTKIAEAIQPLFKKEEKVAAKDVTMPLKEEITRLSKKVNAIIAENLKLKTEVEKTRKSLTEEKSRPLAEKAKAPKIAEALRTEKKVIKEEKEIRVEGIPQNIINEILYLSGKR